MIRRFFKKKVGPLLLSSIVLLSGGIMYSSFDFSFSKTKAEEYTYSESSDFKTSFVTDYKIESTWKTAPLSVTPYNVVSSLLGSTVYGAWDSQYSIYNCYGYAINEYDSCYNIGFFSNQDCWDSSYHIYPVNRLASIVKDDLNTLGYNCVKLQQNTFSIPQNGQSLICVRRSDDTFTDFHFMKYDNGSWYHKPGTSWVLKYNGTPSASVPWYWEGRSYNDGNPYFWRSDNQYYNGDIYFISYKAEHIYTCRYYSDSLHLVLCDDCSNGYYEEHTIKRKLGRNFCTGCYAEFDDDGHGSIIITNDEKPIS